MFEEVPRERRGLAGLLPVRRVVLGPFVFGGGMLLAALGGSVAVAAAAATMITASAISSNDVPPRPVHPVSSSSSAQQTLSARRPPVHHQPVRPTPTAAAVAPASEQGKPTSPSGAGAPNSTRGAPAPARTVAVQPPAGTTAAPTATPSGPAGSPSPTPSSSAPLGNAVIHVSGYRQASRRLVYQFASVQAGAGIDGGDLYQVIDSDTFSAALAPSITITSGGTLCPPAGSTCTVDQLIGAADTGFFAVVAIDARGELRSVLEVGDQSAAAKLAPAPGPPPTTSATPTGAGGHRGGTPPAPSSSPRTSS